MADRHDEALRRLYLCCEADDQEVVYDANSSLRAYIEENRRIEAERDALKREAQIWALEAKTQRSIVNRCAQVVCGSNGECGDWRTEEVVAERFAALRAVAEADDERPYHCDGCCRPNDFSHCAGCEHSQENEDWSNRQALKAAAREVGAL